MKRLILAIAAVALTATLALPAQADRVPRTVKWVCDVPGEGLVTFVSAAEAARQGINIANLTAGQVFHNKFGEVCTVE